MKIIIPVSKSDVHLITDHANALLAKGSLLGHEVIYAPTPEVEEQAMSAAEKLRAICQQVSVVKMPHNFKNGWPQAANNHWHAVAMHLETVKSRTPWLWLELDAVPVKEGWANALLDAYMVGNQPFLGCMKPVLRVAPDGTTSFKEGDLMMMGVAIYPPGIPFDLEIKPLFNNMGLTGAFAPKDPFDLYLRWTFRRRGVTDSPLICDMWRSDRYELRDGVIHCQPMEGEKHARSGAIPETAVLVHGCKDGSLHRLVAASKPVRVESVPVSWVVKPQEVKYEAKPAEPLTQKDTEICVTAAQLLTFIESGPKMRVSAILEHFKVEREVIDPLLKEIGYEVAASNWVRKALITEEV